MTTIEDLLGQGASLEGPGGGWLTLAPVFQGFPETAHGGSVLAAFDQFARAEMSPTTPRTITAWIQKPVPLETGLPLTIEASDSGIALTLAHHGRILAKGTVKPQSSPEADGSRWKGWSGSERTGWVLPATTGCLACGTENPVGLHLRLSFDEEAVWSDCHPPQTFRAPSGHLVAALFPILLDEIGWWLGALASGEAGVTTEVRVTLDRPAHPFGENLLVLGRRDEVAAVDRKKRFWRSEAAVFTMGGDRLAWGEITFAASRAYSARLIPKMLATNAPESLRRVFPRSIQSPASDR